MNKKSIFTILVILLITTIIISLYSTFAYDEEAKKLEESNANYNLVYSVKNSTDKVTYVSANTTKYVDIVLENTNNGVVKYGIYYKLIKPNKIPDGVSITLDNDSKDGLESTIDVGETKTVTIKITNNSEYNLDLVIGSLVGFQNGNIEELIEEGEVLIK